MFDWNDFPFAYSNLVDQTNDLWSTIEALRKLDLNIDQKKVLKGTLSVIAVALNQYASEIRSEINEEEKGLQKR